MALVSLLCAAQLVLPQSCSGEMFCSGATEAILTLLLFFLSSLQEKVRLRYRLSFTLGDQPSTEVGEVDQFPPVEQWGNL